MNKKIILLRGSGNPELAEKVGECLGLKVHQTVSRFADNEARIDIPVIVDKKEVFIIQPANPPFVDNLYNEILGILDAVKRFGARRVTTVIPYFGYSRSDYTDGRQTAIMAEVWGRALEYFGADQIITVDLHSESSKKSVKIPWQDLSARGLLINALQKRGLGNLIVLSPDEGGIERAKKFSRDFGSGTKIAHFQKRRDPNVPDEIKVLKLAGGVVKDKNVLIVDDMLSTGGTLVKAVDLLIAEGASSAKAAITHGLFSDNALEKITSSAIEEIFITDSIPVRAEVLASPKIKIVSIAPLLAEAISQNRQ